MSIACILPYPIPEAEKIPKKYHKRFSVLPGVTCLWVLKGRHEISFDEIKDYYAEDTTARLLYKAVMLSLFAPQILIRAFYEILRFKA